MKFISSRLHGVIDYAAATGLVLFPIILGFEGLPLILSAAAGLGLFSYSVVTDYTLSPSKMLPMRAHLAIDAAAALVFLVAPFVFGWSGIVFAYYLTMGAAVAVVVAATEIEKETQTVAIDEEAAATVEVLRS